MALHAAIAWSAYARSGAVGWLLLGMLYAMGKYVFTNLHDWSRTPLASKNATGPEMTGAPSPFLVRMVRLAGHADVRWHLWIVLAACGRLNAALACYAVYFPRAYREPSAARKGGCDMAEFVRVSALILAVQRGLGEPASLPGYGQLGQRGHRRRRPRQSRRYAGHRRDEGRSRGRPHVRRLREAKL